MCVTTKIIVCVSPVVLAHLIMCVTTKIIVCVSPVVLAHLIMCVSPVVLAHSGLATCNNTCKNIPVDSSGGLQITETSTVAAMLSCHYCRLWASDTPCTRASRLPLV